MDSGCRTHSFGKHPGPGTGITSLIAELGLCPAAQEGLLKSEILGKESLELWQEKLCPASDSPLTPHHGIVPFGVIFPVASSAPGPPSL